MKSREDVIKGLEIVWDAFNHMEHELYADYVYDALAMLKAQEQSRRDYESATEMAQYCERYEPTYNTEDGSL